ncbi:MAG TPA: DEAD/DEAH box helicase [Chitinophagales bacterium]|nr:DEAD/DEAH box helicase [Chitinophagales bacterium]
MPHYYLQFKPSITAASLLQYNSRESLYKFELYLKRAIEALKAKEVEVSWKKTPKQYLTLKLIDYVYQTTPFTTISIITEPGWYKIKSTDGQVEADIEEPIKVASIKRKFSIAQENYKIIGDSHFVRLPELEGYQNWQVIWGFPTYELIPFWVNNLAPINEVKLNGKNSKWELLSPNELKIGASINNSDDVILNGESCSFVVTSISHLPPNIKVLCELSDSVTFSTKTRIDKPNLYKPANYNPIENNDTLVDFSDATIIDRKNLVFSVPNPQKFIGKEIATQKGVRFHIEVSTNKDKKDEFWIQLEELDKDIEENEEIGAFSVIDYFFDDNVNELADGNQNRFNIVAFNKEEQQIVLKSSSDKSYAFPETGTLRLLVDVYQFKMQLRAISTLLNTPIGSHHNILKLLLPKKAENWLPVNQTSIYDWKILTDESRSGIEEQRSFVQKALATPDFAIMEGPPGSGKTTVILELIYQLCKSGKRVLLCGSTHVAIDNVLERIKEKNLTDVIFPLRIGDVNRISESVREFQIETLKQSNKLNQYNDLLVESANLVCGTTTGILQHPDIKGDRYKDTPILPQYDYLIIDECSKTTFQEFLVPALYANKWVLIGDIMQLSPFTDRSIIEDNIRCLQVKRNGTLPNDIQTACFLLFFIELFRVKKKEVEGKPIYMHNKFIIPVSTDTLAYLQKEWEAGKTEKFSVGFVLNVEQAKKEGIQLLTHDVLFVELGKLNEMLDFIPESFMVLDKNWQNTTHAFRHNRYYKNRYYIDDRGKKLDNSFDIVAYLLKWLSERDWASELTWRLVRHYELRFKMQNQDNREQKSGIESQIESLLPKSIKVWSQVFGIKKIALPSILEALKEGIVGRRNESPSVLTDGFEHQDLMPRYTKLVYQHRMHSAISQFPRRKFYTKDVKYPALKDATGINDRPWAYNHFPQKCWWIDVPYDGWIGQKGNFKEVEAVKAELDKFFSWLKQQGSNIKAYEIAVLAFYQKQERALREMLRTLCNQEHKISRFNRSINGVEVSIKLYTVDKFQGQEADMVFLSLMQNKRVGFLDSPNRLNVALTRARHQLVIVGNRQFFEKQNHSKELQELAQSFK